MEFIPAGLMRDRIAIQEIKTEDINGSRVGEEWVDVYGTNALIKNMSGKRQLEYGQILQSTGFDIMLRYNNDIPFADCNEGEIKQRYRIVQRNGDGTVRRNLTIHAVEPSDFRRTYTIIAYETK